MPDPDYVAKWGPGPFEAADVLLVTEDDEVWLIRRLDGSWAMPGGFLEKGETPIEGALRECFEETGVELSPGDLVGSFRAEGPDRDPRAHINTTVHVFELPPGVTPVAGDDAQAVLNWSFQAIPAMYADHRELVIKGVKLYQKSGWLARYAKCLNAVSEAKRKMVDRDLTLAKCTCPKCGVKDALVIRLTPQRRDRSGFHARWACGTDGCGFAGIE